MELKSIFDNEINLKDYGDKIQKIKKNFDQNNEFIVLPDILSKNSLDMMVKDFEKLRPFIHRSFIPNHKKGGSVSRPVISQTTPIFDELYSNKKILTTFSEIAGKKLFLCPDDDLHACAIYTYTEEGDHIGFHFDTSYYKGARYTALLGLIDDSSCRLEYEANNSKKETVINSVKIRPGDLVFFNGDNIKHRVTPAKKNETRVVLTLEYVTNQKMAPFLKFVSNMKDAIAYFGFKQVFKITR